MEPHAAPRRVDRPTLVTPEAVALDLPLAGIGSRGVAIAIDLAIVSVGLVALSLASGLVDGFLSAIPTWVATTLLILFFSALLFGYPIGFETLWGGRTPGKAALGLRVVTEDGGPVRFRHAATRAVLGIVDLQVSFGAVALFTAFISARSQRLGDIVAGTLVVRERSGAAAASATSFSAPVGLEGVVAQLDTQAVGAGEYGAVRALLRRLPTLPADRAEQLATDLLARVGPSVRPPLPRDLPATVALQTIAAAVQRRGETTRAAAPPTATLGFDAWGARTERDAPAPSADRPPTPPSAGGFTPPA